MTELTTGPGLTIPIVTIEPKDQIDVIDQIQLTVNAWAHVMLTIKDLPVFAGLFIQSSQRYELSCPILRFQGI